MSHSSMASLMDVELHPGKPPVVRAETRGDAANWAAGHRNALRAVVAEHGCVLIRGLGLRDAAETGALPADRVQRVEREGWMLVRIYNEDFGASVEEAFGTAGRGEVERYCRANATEFEWQPDGTLRTWQRRSAVVRHPVTGQRC